MYCPNCGKRNNDDALFCQYCGVRRAVTAPLTPPVASTQAPKTSEPAPSIPNAPRSSDDARTNDPQSRVPEQASRPSSPLPMLKEESVEGLVNDINGLVIKMRDIFPEATEKEWVKVAKTGDREQINKFYQAGLLPIIKAYDQMVDRQELNPGEKVYWSHDVHKGIISSTLVERWVITNLRAMIERPAAETRKRSMEAIGLATCNVMVMNQRRKRGSSPVGGYAGSQGTGVGTGSSQSTSATSGDLVFLFNGKEEFRFSGISDPNGVKSMVMALKKQIKA